MRYLVWERLGGADKGYIAIEGQEKGGAFFHGSFRSLDDALIFSNKIEAIKCADDFARWHFAFFGSLLRDRPRTVEVVEVVDGRPAGVCHSINSGEYLRSLSRLDGVAADLGVRAENLLQPELAVVELLHEARLLCNPPDGPRYQRLLALARMALVEV